MTISDKKTFCTAPWVTIQVEPSGAARPCCIGGSWEPDKATYGNLNKQTWAETINGEGIRNLRKAFINNEKPADCKVCWDKEEIHGPFAALRNNFNRHRFEERFITDTLPDGTFHDMKLTYWDFRPNNICNLSCLMCSEQLSSGVWQMREDIGYDHQLPNKFVGLSEERFNEIFESMADNLKKYHSETQIYWAGGEPLIMPEHQRIMDHLVENEYWDVYLRYNSNLSALKFKGIDWIDVWKKFNLVEINASIDATGRPGEIQRLGSNWELIKSNIIKLRDAGILVSFNATTTMLTYPYILDTIRELEEIFPREHLNKHLNFVKVEGHENLDIRMTPKEHLDFSIVDQMDSLGYNSTILRSVLASYDEFNSDESKVSSRWERLHNLHTRLKLYKNTDLAEVLPWLETYTKIHAFKTNNT